MCAITVLIIL